MLAFSIAIAIASIAAAGLFLAWRTRRDVARLEARFPPLGRIIEMTDQGRPRSVHVLDIPGNPELLPVVFIHGASGNLYDQVGAFRDAVARLPHSERFRSIYVDRPGCGYTERRATDNTPRAQAAMVAATLDGLGIERAVICGHSFGAGVAVTMAVAHPEKVAALALLAPAAYPWPADLGWPYKMASLPVVRTICAWTFVVPLGRRLVPPGVLGTFAPDAVPDAYQETGATELLLRPANFLANAADILAIKARAAEISPLFAAIRKPTWILQGARDAVVRPTIHAVGLHRAIDGSRLEWHEGVGHKPDYVFRDRIVRELVAFARESEGELAEAAE